MFKSRFLGFMIAVFLWPLAKSWRFRYFCQKDGTWQRVAKKELPAANCLALLHGHQLPLVAFSPYKKLAALASRSKDGEIAATLLALYGIKALRGSSSRGGQAALDLAVAHVKNGGEIAITVDGPRGPRGTCKRGIMEIARQCGVKAQTLAVRCQKSIRLKSWDGFLIPYPFARINVMYGQSYGLPETAGQDDIYAACGELARELTNLETLDL